MAALTGGLAPLTAAAHRDGQRGSPRPAQDDFAVWAPSAPSTMAAMRMRRSFDELEEAFAEESVEDRERRESLQRRIRARSRRRHLEREHKHGSIRFVLVLLILLTTAIVVTIAMFETLYYVMGPD